MAYFGVLSSGVLTSGLLSLSVVSVAATMCDLPVLSLPLRDVQVLPSVKDSYMRGIPLQVGTATQDLVVLPWA